MHCMSSKFAPERAQKLFCVCLFWFFVGVSLSSILDTGLVGGSVYRLARPASVTVTATVCSAVGVGSVPARAGRGRGGRD
ncbi:hypothetical protein BaRGS_00017439 [Batillaria attramentaria]|uniref:Uncharacterized protein n=1 Tax=Batillaria attramentaria TaxID=370345 RepID=A0ABD0KW09_9CAEN